ncbi:MAG: sigma-54 dependent transcriptional regulator [Desulfobacterales bacterium]|jgi:DNA-binding NtrC family response regulator
MTKGHSYSILIVDDEKGVRESLRMVLQDDYDLYWAETGEEALRQFESRSVDIILLDIMLPDIDGRRLIQNFKAIDDNVEIIMVSALKDLRSGIEAIKSGAHDYLVKPFDVENVKAIVARAMNKKTLQKEVLLLKREVDHCRHFETMVGRNPEMKKVFRMIATIAPSDGTVLIQGESGTGKELVARAIHNQSGRARNPFVVINCAAIPATLMESELFGHRRGAFTGASTDCPGKLEIANTGTVFLDDIDSLSIKMQAKLLRVIQQKEFERIGTHRIIKADIRIIASSNQDLLKLVSENRFRQDLFYRLNVLPISLPPLRKRRDDIPHLLDHFLNVHAQRKGEAAKQLTPAAVDHLTAYHWPGNVRELENLVERICTINPEGTIRLGNLPHLAAIASPQEKPSLREATQAFEKQYIQSVLEAAKGNKAETARRLGIHRNTLMSKIKELDIVLFQ